MIRKATLSDIDRLVEIKLAGVAKMHENGNTVQYQTGVDSYPGASDFTKDIEVGNLYVFDDGEVLGFYYFCDHDEQPFVDQGYTNSATVHRIFVDVNTQGKGIGKQMIQHAVDRCKELKKDYLMIDTHPLNKPLQVLASKFNFIQIEDIYWKEPKNDINVRLAYYKQI